MNVTGELVAPPSQSNSGLGHAARRRRSGKEIGAILTRYSTRDQCSTADQVRKCREFAEARGIEIPEHFVFSDEGKTGRSRRRERFQALLKAIGNGEVDTVLIFKTSRLFRKTYKALQFVHEEIVSRGLRCIFVAQGIDTADEKQWMSLLHLHAVMDEMQATSGVDHIRAAQEGLFLQGLVSGTISYGYRGEEVTGQLTRSGKPRRRLVVCPDTSKWVKQAFAWYTTGEGTRSGIPSIDAVVKLLNDSVAPLPPRCATGHWTRLAVRRLLTNPRYRGQWDYGATRTVWLDKQDYARQIPREDGPVKSIQVEELRLVSDEVWFKTQELIAGNPHVAGRPAQDGNYTARPRILNGLAFCAYHNRALVTGGGYGKKMLCPVCQATDKKLFTYLDRRRATQVLCETIAGLIQADKDLVSQVISACQVALEARQQPNQNELDDLRRQLEAIAKKMKAVEGWPVETDEDARENQRVVGDLRKERARLHAEISRLEAATAYPPPMPTETEVRALVDGLAEALLASTTGDDRLGPGKVRRIVEIVTGGRLVMEQVGEPTRDKGWIRGRFTAHVLQLVAGEFGLAPKEDGVEVVIDFREQPIYERIADSVKTFYDAGLKYTEIAKKVGFNRNLVTAALAYWHESRGLPVPDGRTCPGRMKRPQRLAERIADQVMDLIGQDMPLQDIARELNTSRNRITEAINTTTPPGLKKT